jgi:O-succinylbenzoate synthase
MTIPSFGDMVARLHAVSIPLVTEFRGITHREILVFDGPDGPAEWSPFVDYDDQEARTWLLSTLEQGWNQESLSLPVNPPSTMGVNGTFPAIDATEVSSFIEKLNYPTTLKIKVGGPGSTLREDVARVQAARGALGPAGRIRLDANGYWSLDEAEHAIRAMESSDIDYVEQPVATLSDMAELRRRVARLGIQIAADESIRRFSDIDQVLKQEACDVVIIKVQPLGGLSRSTEVIRRAREAGVEVVISSALESSVGIHYGALLVHLQMSQGALPMDAGLGTVALLAGDIVQTPLIPVAGTLTITDPVLDPARLAKYEMSQERTDWWVARLERCLALF